MSIVSFNPTAFKARYPEFVSVSDNTLSLYFDEATLYLNNTDTSLVVSIPERTILLNLLVAHIAQLVIAPLVGRINSATQGSVSAGTDYGVVTNTQAWYVQTKYGAEYWALTAKYRTMQYRAGRSYPAKSPVRYY